MANSPENSSVKNSTVSSATNKNKQSAVKSSSITKLTNKQLAAKKAAMQKRKKAALQKKKIEKKAQKKANRKKNRVKNILSSFIFILTFSAVMLAVYVVNFTQTGLPTPFSLIDISKDKGVVNETIIPQTQKAEENYFDNILFIGDSLSVGLKAYNYMPASQVYALTGLNLTDALTKKFITFSNSSKQYSISGAVAKTKPQKIIFLMGINGIAWTDNKTHLDQYEEMIRQIISASPNSVIALQSVYPVTANYTANEPRITNKKIDEFNKGIIEIAKELNIYYLDVASVLKDSKGNLKQELSSDGLHVNKDGYDIVLDYILQHQF